MYACISRTTLCSSSRKELLEQDKQHAFTISNTSYTGSNYAVVDDESGYTWLELSPSDELADRGGTINVVLPATGERLFTAEVSDVDENFVNQQMQLDEKHSVLQLRWSVTRRVLLKDLCGTTVAWVMCDFGGYAVCDNDARRGADTDARCTQAGMRLAIGRRRGTVEHSLTDAEESLALDTAWSGTMLRFYEKMQRASRQRGKTQKYGQAPLAQAYTVAGTAPFSFEFREHVGFVSTATDVHVDIPAGTPAFEAALLALVIARWMHPRALEDFYARRTKACLLNAEAEPTWLNTGHHCFFKEEEDCSTAGAAAPQVEPGLIRVTGAWVGGTSFELKNPGISISALRAEIYQRWRVPPREQKLSLGDKLLSSEPNLLNLGNNLDVSCARVAAPEMAPIKMAFRLWSADLMKEVTPSTQEFPKPVSKDVHPLTTVRELKASLFSTQQLRDSAVFSVDPHTTESLGNDLTVQDMPVSKRGGSRLIQAPLSSPGASARVVYIVPSEEWERHVAKLGVMQPTFSASS
eukprot:gnl/TRDRNA2_/TRDRNA2_81839_c0_seq1.p1 gnl/TRDRNA2_/TRDRNA2_81839_c0~~gnl/TRDRNA2_/TRDRNA2_81839_c0_seq1.p1  ORF type:complete len:523 (+),score=105.02 gnl/TRDRNA2_/TRDRNA2_81839_c0_seq1:48-1616(+)